MEHELIIGSRLAPPEAISTRTKFQTNQKQEEKALWTGIEGSGSIHDGDGTIGHGLIMDIAKGLSTY